MSVFTIFFCGTGSNSFDNTNANYHRGELVSTLARNHGGREFVDWIIVDGPGSGNLQEAEKWSTAGNYNDTRGKLQGAGWEENVAHAVAVVKGATTEGRTTHDKKELKVLREAGIGEIQRVPGRLWGSTEKHVLPHARISPQELQSGLVKVLRKPITTVNVIGWSRGGVTCHMFANAMAEVPELGGININIFACDPVPGQGGFQAHRIGIRGRVTNYVAIYANDERSRGFSPVLPSLPASTVSFVTTIPGRHATLVGNAAIDGSTGAGGNGINGLVGPGRVTRDLAERYLTSWGTTLTNQLNMADTEILKSYDEMLAQSAHYQAMHNTSYTYYTQKGPRPVGLGNGTFADFARVATLTPNPYFVNRHHEAVFARRYTRLYSAIFMNVPTDRDRLELELFNLRMMYPHLNASWKGKGILQG